MISAPTTSVWCCVLQTAQAATWLLRPRPSFLLILQGCSSCTLTSRQVFLLQVYPTPIPRHRQKLHMTLITICLPLPGRPYSSVWKSKPKLLSNHSPHLPPCDSQSVYHACSLLPLALVCAGSALPAPLGVQICHLSYGLGPLSPMNSLNT